MRTLRLGLLGCGTVGSGVVQLIHQRAERFRALGIQIELMGVLVRDLQRPRAVQPDLPLTTDASFVPDCEVLVEVMGGVERPLALCRDHLLAGKPLVSANKAMLAERWSELRPYAERGQLHYEASVMAGTPVLGPLSTTLRASRVTHLEALLNATCTFILGRMEAGEDYLIALREAQHLGYAEEDPTLDVSGVDAAQKLVILARLVADPAFGLGQVQCEGIDALPAGFFAEAHKAGERVRLVAELTQDVCGWQARVSPRRLPATHPFCAPGAGRNALRLQGEGCGELYFAGASAGGLVTASAVVGDLLSAVSGVPGHRPLPTGA
ncbi:homoserine dehydrogenase [Deinococcus peraridilitoris]|uniref:Homoserine dehydrogenase n=1 Tax=Deinococcus peraridilitoris (strain DSM 19664 / LMG 22246 / CIP 109416 / KR-200) TaxID=937777 RepID=K9ZYE3_DEIPD|nr:homoserine dehydrogenase [Deinococcus peraridilitoris]AFZ65775.1 homoserine dehydrogenase [Deinococcus peraridilitoris DSM 19664]